MKTLLSYINESNESTQNSKIFVIIKPGFTDLSGEIIKEFKKRGFVVDKIRTKRLLLSEAKELYKIHKDEKFYEPLCKYMSSDISTAIIFRNDNLLMSIFRVVGNIKDKIRKEYGESDMRNVIHSSDSYEHMQDEYKVYFNTI